MIKSRMMRWARHIAYRVLGERRRTNGHYKELDVDGWIILKYILEKSVQMLCTGVICFRTGTSGGSCENGNKSSGSTKTLKNS
jgi:hypothetical protein